MTVSEAELDFYIEQHRPDAIHYTPFTRDFWREQAEAAEQHRARTLAKTTKADATAADVAQLRRRAAELERMVLGEKAILVEAVGTLLGKTHGELESRIKVLEGRDPVSLPVPDWNNPTVHYCGLWNAKHLYGPGALVTYNGAGWIAMSAMGAGVRPGAGETGWRLAVKSDTASLRAIVKDEVRKQLREHAR
jgi:hypothetical protein